MATSTTSNDTLRRSSRKTTTTPETTTTTTTTQNTSAKTTSAKTTRNTTAKKQLETYCICKRPDDHNFMIQCDTCKEWFHGGCVGISKDVGEQMEEYMCPLCEEPGSRNGKLLSQSDDKSKSSRRRRSHRDSTEEELSSDEESSSPATPVSLPFDVDDRSSRESSPGYTLPNPKEKSCLYPGCENPARPADNYCSDSCTIADADNILARLAAREAEHARTFDGTVKRPTGPPPKTASPSSTTYASLGTTPNDIPASPPSLCSHHPENEEDVQGSENYDISEPQKSYSSEDEEDKARVQSDPIRMTVRKGLSKTFTEILQGLQEQGDIESEAMKNTPIDVLATKWANSCERAMLKHWADRPSTASSGSINNNGITGTRYRARFRTIQFNLKDAKNDRLRTRLATGRVLPRDLAVLSSEEMASDELLEEAEESRKRSLQQTVIVEDVAPDTINGRLVKKTHKGWIEVERDDGGMFSSTSPTLANSPSEPFPRSDLKRKDDAIERRTSMQRSESTDITSTSDSSKRLRIDTSSNSSSETSPVTSTAPPMSAGSTVQNFFVPRQESPLPSSPGEEELPDFLSGLEAPSLESSTSLSDDMDPLPTASPPSSPPTESVTAPEINVWKGEMAFEELGKWAGCAVHVLGRNSPLDTASVSGPSFQWAKILSATAIPVAGRIPPDRVGTYLSQQRWSTSKEVVAVLFRPNPDEVQTYLDFWDYLHSRTRYGVVKTFNNGYVKDFYIVPYEYGTPLPEFLKELPGRVPPSLLKNVSSADGKKILLGAILLNKSPINPSASLVPEEKQQQQQQQQQRATPKRDPVVPSPVPSTGFSTSSLLSQIPGLASIPPPSSSIVPQASPVTPQLNPIVSQLLMNLSGSLSSTTSSPSHSPAPSTPPPSTLPQQPSSLYGQHTAPQLLNGNTSGLSPAALAVVAMAAAKARGTAPDVTNQPQYPDRPFQQTTPPNSFPWPTMMNGGGENPGGGYGRGGPENPSFAHQQGYPPNRGRVDPWNRPPPPDMPVRPTEDHRFRAWNQGDRNHYGHQEPDWDRRMHHEGPPNRGGRGGGHMEIMRGRGRGGARGRGGEMERNPW